MEITTEAIKELRDKTGISVMQCKKALEEAQGDMEKALGILAMKSRDIAGKKTDRELAAGVVAAYIHGTKEVGAMVTLSCETDFVAKNEEFSRLAYDIAMHAAAMRPRYIKREDVPESLMNEMRETLKKEVDASKPADIQEKILEGKLAAQLATMVLNDQPYIKDDTKTIKSLTDAAVQKFGERTEVTNLAIFSTR